MRCFLAVPVEEPALGAVRHQLSAWRDQVHEVRWVRPDALHLTVHFFGSIDDERVAAATAAVTPVAAATRRYNVTLDTLGAFPSRKRPRVLWLGSSREVPELATLAGKIRAALSGIGFEVESRPFRAHCTLGRPRLPWPADSQHAWERALAEAQRPATFTASRLVLYESVHAAGGNRYEERVSRPFGS